VGSFVDQTKPMTPLKRGMRVICALAPTLIIAPQRLAGPAEDEQRLELCRSEKAGGTSLAE